VISSHLLWCGSFGSHLHGSLDSAVTACFVTIGLIQFVDGNEEGPLQPEINCLVDEKRLVDFKLWWS